MDDQNTLALPRRHSRSLVQDVMTDLIDKIHNGSYKPGDKLPTEPELMFEQGVSRTVVREAISRLQAAGLVETRHGVGSFVLALAASKRRPLDMRTAITIRDVLSMLELRISVETEAAGLAATRRSHDQVVRMRRAINAFEKRGDERSVGTDFRFHMEVARATGNKYFEEFYSHLGTATIPRAKLDTAQFSEEPGQSYLQLINREHEYILDAIARGDAEIARAGMRMHLTNSRERLKRVSTGVLPE